MGRLKVKVAVHAIAIPEHEVELRGRRYRLPASEHSLHAPSRTDAIKRAVRSAHIAAGVPPYRCLLGQTEGWVAARTDHVEIQR